MRDKLERNQSIRMPQIETELIHEEVRVPCNMHIAYIDDCK